ncbi:MAG: Cys-tRNA(Pro) deacylase [Syntrophorhabdales bacterium]
MSRENHPVTPAIRALRENGVAFTEHPYSYENKGGTAVCARELSVDEHSVVKTLVMEDDAKHPLIVLMHGDREVSTKELARHIGAKRIVPCAPETAERHTGYMVGGISPFGTRKTMPVYMEETISDLPRVYINGGRRGFLVGLDPREIERILKPALVKVGI